MLKQERMEERVDQVVDQASLDPEQLLDIMTVLKI